MIYLYLFWEFFRPACSPLAAWRRRRSYLIWRRAMGGSPRRS